MNAQDVLKTYAMFYVSENDDFNAAKKLDMLNFIEQADEGMIMDLFENNEIEAPFDLLESDPVYEVDEKALTTTLGEADLLITEMDSLTEKYTSLERAQDTLKMMLGQKKSLEGQLMDAKGEVVFQIKTKLLTLDGKISKLKNSISKMTSGAVEKAKDMAGEAGEAIKSQTDKAGKAVEKGAKAVRDVAGDVGEKVSGAAGKAADFAKDQPGAVGAAVAAAAALTAGVMAYRKFFSKAAKACSGSPDKKACLAQYKMKAKQAQISTLNAGKAKCAKSKNPATCKAKIDSKISALKAKK